jgi:hypothetical protein
VVATLFFYGFMFIGSMGGKTWLGSFQLIALMLWPIFFVYLPLRFLPLRFAISQYRYLLTRPSVRIPLFLFAASPFFLMILFYIVLQSW